MSNYTVKTNNRTVRTVKAKNCYDACVRAIKATPRQQRQKGDRFVAMSPGGGRSYAITLAH